MTIVVFIQLLLIGWRTKVISIYSRSQHCGNMMAVLMAKVGFGLVILWHCTWITFKIRKTWQGRILLSTLSTDLKRNHSYIPDLVKCVIKSAVDVKGWWSTAMIMYCLVLSVFLHVQGYQFLYQDGRFYWWYCGEESAHWHLQLLSCVHDFQREEGTPQKVDFCTSMCAGQLEWLCKVLVSGLYWRTV